MPLYKIIDDGGDEYYVEADGIALAVMAWQRATGVETLKDGEPDHVTLLSHEPVIR